MTSHIHHGGGGGSEHKVGYRMYQQTVFDKNVMSFFSICSLVNITSFDEISIYIYIYIYIFKFNQTSRILKITILHSLFPETNKTHKILTETIRKAKMFDIKNIMAVIFEKNTRPNFRSETDW